MDMHQAVNIPGFEQRVRERAYALWEREGRPFGRDVEHWRASELAALVEIADAPAPAKKAAKPKAAARKVARPTRSAPLELSASA
jgi:DUF2934 family protein